MADHHAVWYRADHVGSLLRPQELLDARSSPEITRDALSEIEDRHILRVLERQKAAGLEIFTDGELRRAGFMSDFYESVEGWITEARSRDRGPAPSRIGGTSGSGGAARISGIVIGKIRQTKRLTSHEVGFLKKHSARRHQDDAAQRPTSFPPSCTRRA